MDSVESEQGAFNAAIEYLRTLTTIERNIIEAFMTQNFEESHNLLDCYWLVLAEWFNPTEEKEHDVLRQEQHKAHSEIIQSKQNGKKSISRDLIEKYYTRFKALNKIIHKKGLRMPKKDDPAFALGGKSY